MQLFVRDREFYKKIAIITIPIVLQSMITSGVNMMDTIMVGQLGEVQLSAVSLANQYIIIYHIMCLGLGFGAAVLTSQFWGNNDIDALKKIITLMLRISIVIGLVFTLFTLFIPNQIMNIYTPNQDIILEGVKYFTISAFTLLPLGISLTLTAVLRSVGEVKLPLRTAIGAFILNIFFNWVFIFGKLGMPRLETKGAAIGTLIARLFELIVIVGFLLLKDQKIRYRLRDFLLSTQEYVKVYIKYAIPVLVSDTLLAVGNNMVAVIIGHIGATFVAAYAIVSQTARMATIFTQGVSNSSSIITGNTVGEGDLDKAYRQGITFTLLSLIIGIIAGAFILITSPWIVGLFTLTQETKEVTYQLMFAAGIMVVFQSVQSVLTKGVLRGGGDTMFLMVADILFLWLASIPLGYLTGLCWGFPVFWVYIALKTDWIIKAIWCTGRLHRRKWLKPIRKISLDESID